MKGEMMMIKWLDRKHISVFMIVLVLFTLLPGFSEETAGKTNVESPIVHDDGTVTFYYEGTESDQVRVAGSFTDWEENALKMDEVDGLWTVTTDVLTPDVYQYKLILGDSDWILDPLNPSEISGNNKLVVQGINLKAVPSLLEQNSTVQLKGHFIGEDGNSKEESSAINWSLEGAPSSVELNGEKLTIGKDTPIGTTFSIIATYESYTAKKAVEVSGQLKKYTVNYHRIDNNLEDWNLHIFDGGYEPENYDFDSTTTVHSPDGEEFVFSTGTFSFPNDSLKLIPRKGDWESQDSEFAVHIPEGESEIEVWIIQGFHEVFTSENAAIRALTTSLSPHIRFVYERPDENYKDWDVWVWGTGTQDDNIDFTGFEAGKAIANIGVGPNIEQVGFKVRKGNWEEEEPGGDRYIKVNPLDPITKVYVNSGQTDFFTVPAMKAPTVSNGNATFYYRDKDLYLSDQMSKIDKVELGILGERYEMVKEEKNERFVYTYKDLPSGEHEYTFFVTMDGKTTEVVDPYFAIDGKSVISFFESNIEVDGAVSPKAIDYNENAVLTLDIVNEEEVELREISVDLTGVGGKANVAIDPALKAVTISVRDSTTAGVKKLPIKVIDEYGNEHIGEAEITVKTRKFIGENDFDWDEARIYFLLTDRFFNGDPSNDDPYGIGYDKNDPGAYQGGDFKGITKKLDYLQDLGINTIWISPIVENIAHDVRYLDDPHFTPYYAYHGYWASNFSEINPHFGTMEDLHELIDEAHARGIKLMVDVVLNHAGYGLKKSDASMEDKIPHFPTTQDRERFAGMFRDGGSGDIQGELSGLPDFITEDDQVRQQLIKWQTDWIEKSKTPQGNTIDYFRVDTVKHVENTTWMAFKNALTKELPTFKLIGEVWGASQFDDYGFLNAGMMDSLLDFDFKYQARDFVHGKIDSVETNLKNRNEMISNTASLGQFLSSHDEDGFLEQFKEEEGALGKLMVAASLQVTAKGQPVIYYGEELGISGENNYPYLDNRNNLPWDQVEGNKVLEHYTKILNARKDYSAIFSKGTRDQLAGGDELGYSVFARSYEGESVVVALNTNKEMEKINIAVPFESDERVVDIYSGQTIKVDRDQTVTVEIPGMSNGGTVILVAEKTIDEPIGNESSGEDKTPIDAEKPGNQEKPNNKDNQMKQEEKVDQHSKKTGHGRTNGTSGKELPNTSTQMYRNLLVGFVLLLIGGSLYALRRKR